jgi:hypothetical protein
MRRSTGEMIDSNGTPMTLTHETVEYFPDKLQHLCNQSRKCRLHAASAAMLYMPHVDLALASIAGTINSPKPEFRTIYAAA